MRLPSRCPRRRRRGPGHQQRAPAVAAARQVDGRRDAADRC